MRDDLDRFVFLLGGTEGESLFGLFFLHSVIEPGALRIELSRGLGAIRKAQGGRTQMNEVHGAGRPSFADELGKLAAMLDPAC